ncbi:hypothetical protein PR003_g17441 [Phytophthora rubi]|uniref:RxLR effector protein n=1 Tax=Phytophthora rubi TaxID=129364 RepID=A0A6A4E8D9_9STRA|nr:hypothetical protein PR001_g23658 [Phytophthora rubi]KAE9007173.1 hypothetical protein PR002_g16279 [Phytophthora rubi]KAE9321543.1 hypothetical protein PR003_g17441 [Phytophthora rubi]
MILLLLRLLTPISSSRRSRRRKLRNCNRIFSSRSKLLRGSWLSSSKRSGVSRTTALRVRLIGNST